MRAPRTENVRRRQPAARPVEMLYSIEAEQAVLGSMLLSVDAIDKAVEAVTAADFFVPLHVQIFTAVATLRDRGDAATDLVTVAQYLVDTGSARDVQAAVVEIVTATESVGSTLSIGSHLRIVKQRAVLRALFAACHEIIEEITTMPDQAQEILDRAEQKIFAIADRKGGALIKEGGQASAEAIATIEKYRGKRAALFGISTPFHRLDQLTTGWQKGDMIVIAARPGVGKTALSLDIARTAAISRYDVEQDRLVSPGYRPGLFNFEMISQQLILRILSQRCHIPLQRLRKAEINDAELAILKGMSAQMDGEGWRISDDPEATIQQVRAQARRMVARHGVDLLIVDYLQLLRSSTHHDNDQEIVSEVSRGLKQLARELQVPVIVLAQLNRKAEESGKAALHHLRGSGSIEQDADIVILLDRRDDVEGAPRLVVPVELDLAKHRNGPTDTFEIYFHTQITSYSDQK